MAYERLKKPEPILRYEPEKVKSSASTVAKSQPATPAQLQRAKAKLEQDRFQIQQHAEQSKPQRLAREQLAEETRVQRVKDQAVKAEQKAVVQRLAETQAKQQAFFSSFIHTPTQRSALKSIKSSSIQASQTRDAYRVAITPEIVQRLVSTEMTVQAQQARANQQPNVLNAKADWFNTGLPVLRAKHNHPDTPFLDGPSVIKPTDQHAFTLGKTYTVQRLSSGLTPKDAAIAILNIQRKADRDFALHGLLTAINPRQSDHASIQRLVAEGETKLELQRRAIEDAVIPQAMQLAKEQAHQTQANSGISEKIKAKLGGGNLLPENVRQQLETGLNTNLEGVRVHTDGESDKLAKSVNAIAFTTGKDIFFSSGSYDPNTKTGYELIAHEVTHTVQQASGLVSPGVDASSSLEIAAQSKGAELASTFDPNFKYKNLENQAQPNSPLISSQPPAHRAKLQALQRSSLVLQREASKQKLDVGKLNGGQKLFEAIKHAPMGESVKQQLLNAISPQSLGLFALVFGAGAVAQATPVGWAADLIIAGLLVFGFWSVGSIIFDVIKDFAAFSSTALSAKSEDDLTIAGTYFSDAVAKIGVSVVIAMIAHTVAKGVNAKLKAPTAARQPVTAKQIDAKLEVAKNPSAPKPVAEPVETTKPTAKPVKPGGGLEGKGSKPKPGERTQTRAQYEAEQSQARVKAYEARTRTDAQLAKDVNPKPRTGETAKQAKTRAKAAKAEIETRAYDKEYAKFGGKPPKKFRIFENDSSQTGNPHTLARHSADIPLRITDNPTGQTIESRLMPNHLGWADQQNASARWLSNSIMDRSVRQALESNWDQIRSTLAQGKRYKNDFAESKAIGEGFYNLAPSNAPKPIYAKISTFQLIIIKDPTAPGGIKVITTFPKVKW